ADDDHDLVEPGREHLLDREAHERPPAGHRQRELLAPHAGRRPGREDDGRDHQGAAWTQKGPERLPRAGASGPRAAGPSRPTSPPWLARPRARAPVARTRA